MNAYRSTWLWFNYAMTLVSFGAALGVAIAVVFDIRTVAWWEFPLYWVCTIGDYYSYRYWRGMWVHK